MSNDTGRKFEIYVEQLFKDCGFEDVFRNIIYIRRKGWIKKRKVAQADIQVGRPGLFYVPLIYELKYSSNGNIGMSEEKGNPVDQLIRTTSITGFRPGGIITNKSYTSSLVDYAEKKEVKLYDASYLLKLERKRRSVEGLGLICPSLIGKDLDERIELIQKDILKIDPREYRAKARIIYL
jgi:hypothetical protein